jgi:hypothetical protein
MWKSGLVPRRLAVLGLIGGPLILIRATLISFGVVEHGDVTDVLAVPEILWELSLGVYPLVKGFKTPPVAPPPVPPADDWQITTDTGARAAAAATG